MERIRIVMRAVLWPSVIALAGAVVLAVVLVVLGETSAAGVAASVAMVLAIPVGLMAQARPRPGLVWYGSYAEPWRAERSAGQPPEVPDPWRAR